MIVASGDDIVAEHIVDVIAAGHIDNHKLVFAVADTHTQLQKPPQKSLLEPLVRMLLSSFYIHKDNAAAAAAVDTTRNYPNCKERGYVDDVLAVAFVLVARHFQSQPLAAAEKEEMETDGVPFYYACWHY